MVWAAFRQKGDYMSLAELYGSYEANRFGAEFYEVERDRVLGLQALLMTELRPIAVTHRKQHTRPPKITGFSFLIEDNHIDIEPLDMSQDISNEVVQGKIETLKGQIKQSGSDRYFGVMARRLSPRERRLSISVLDYSLGDDIEASKRTIHQFLWRSDSAVALGSRRQVFAGSDAELVCAAAVDGQLELINSGGYYRSVLTETPTGDDFEQLEEQIQQMIDTIKAV